MTLPISALQPLPVTWWRWWTTSSSRRRGEWVVAGWSRCDPCGQLAGRSLRWTDPHRGRQPDLYQKPDLPIGGLPSDVEGNVAAMNDDRVNFLTMLATAICAKPPSDAVLASMAGAFLNSSARASATLAELAHLDQRDMMMALDIPLLSFICGQDGFVAPTSLGGWQRTTREPRA